MIPARFLLVVVALPLLANLARAQPKAPIFIVPALMASNLKVKYTPGGSSAPTTFLNEGQLEALLIARRDASSSSSSSSLRSHQTVLQANSTAGQNATTNSASSGNGTSSSSSTSEALSSADACLPVPVNNMDVWLPSTTLASLAPECWAQMLRLDYVGSSLASDTGAPNAAGSSDRAALLSNGSFVNSTGSQVWADSPGASGMRYTLFKLAGYERLVQFIETTFNYTRGVNLFVLPYDFRQDCSTMEDSGQLQRLANRVKKQVARSGGKKAILIGHSMGSIVALKMLRSTTLRESVQGFLSLSAPLGGAAATVPARVSGAFDYLCPWLVEELSAVLGAGQQELDPQLGGVVREYIYQVSKGMPSVAMMMPYAQAFGGNSVSVTVEGSNTTYTVNQLEQLLEDIGEQGLADSYDQTHNMPSLLEEGPIPGVQTFCIYGSSSDTPVSWRYEQELVAGKANEVPRVDVMGKGDGVVNLESLRLCQSVASRPANVMELAGVTHFSVYSKRTALKAIKKALDTMVRK